MAALYVTAGIFHFVHPDYYMKIMPAWMPWHKAVIFITGVMEIILGILLLPKFTRRFAAWAIIIFLIAVFPANIQMAMNYHEESNSNLWIAVLRLPIQLILIWWAWLYTGSKKINN